MRKYLFSILACAMLAWAPASAAELGDDGLHKEDWFSLTFKDVAEDIATARENGKRLALIFEQRGCIYCKEVHETVLSDPEVRDYIKERFMIVQYNLHGAEEVTDLDGDTLTEKEAARKWRLMFTPSIIFLPEDAPEDGSSAIDAAVAIMPGAFRRGTFLDLFVWVHEKGYEGEESFQDYHGRKSRERLAQREAATGD